MMSQQSDRTRILQDLLKESQWKDLECEAPPEITTDNFDRFAESFYEAVNTKRDYTLDEDPTYNLHHFRQVVKSDIRVALAVQAEAHAEERKVDKRKLEAMKADLSLWTEKLGEAERRLRIVHTSAEGVWRWMGDGSDQPESLTCPVVMSCETLREMVKQISDLKAKCGIRP